MRIQICLIRLLSTADGVALDMNAALTQISTLFKVASELNIHQDGLHGRFKQVLSFSVRDAHLRRSNPGEVHDENGLLAQSRMGGFKLLSGCVLHLTN